MNYKYILKEIEKANKNIYEAYESLEYYKSKKDKKYQDYCTWYITEADEILSDLEISLKIEMEKENDQL